MCGIEASREDAHKKRAVSLFTKRASGEIKPKRSTAIPPYKSRLDKGANSRLAGTDSKEKEPKVLARSGRVITVAAAVITAESRV